MTISKHSQIENVVSGAGNDHIIGNDSDNYIITGKGDDQVFAGNGRDIIDLGSGTNQVNLFEQTASNDFVVFSTGNTSQYNEIYSFDVGGICDVLVFECNIYGSLNLSPVQRISEITNFEQYDIYRISDFNVSSNLDNSLYRSSTDKIILSNTSERPGFDTQVHFFDASNDTNLSVFNISIIATNGADLGSWSIENFMII